ncbi:hypothetical protein RJ641_031029 [Dillenia turbinata]|uniref:Uncharacterized protein n=1 Tax=Dillenia turbinata TaxID=194707 RepID=A0AAN8VWR5_9MAGN
MDGREWEGSSEMEFTDIDISIDSFDPSIIFHVVKEVIGFVLYMHNQIPSILQDVSNEFESLQSEYKDLELKLNQSEVKASSRRKHMGRMREIKHGIRRVDKLVNTVSSVQTALQLLITQIPDIQGVILVLGSSPLRPQHVYELHFSHGRVANEGPNHFTKSRIAEGIAKKAIRALISKGAGSISYAGPTKLFLLIKASSTFNLPLHFLPKRDYRYSKRIVPFRLRFKCKCQELNAAREESEAADSVPANFHSNELIW